MKYCTRCLYPENHPLKITFDEDGVCSGCRIHEEKDSLDWPQREEKLKTLLSQYKSNSRHNYDCIVPVSGARDSYFILHMIKKVYGMNPLLVSYNRHYNTRRGHRNYAYLKTLFNCDAVELIVDPAKVKKITRVTLEKMGSMHWHTLAGSTVFPVQVAVRYNIPLIVWGAHQGLDQVGMFSHSDEVEMTRKYRKEHDLMGVEAEDLSAELTESDVLPYIYPHDKEIEKTGVRGIYLGNYLRWDSKAQHELMIKLYGYETSSGQRSFDTYNDVDCQHYLGIHDYIKFLKWGFGKVTDHASREIRLKRLTRDEGIDLVNRYQNTVPQDLEEFTRWLGKKSGPAENGSEPFYRFFDRFRDPKIWIQSQEGQWTLRDSITNHKGDEGVEKVRLQKISNCAFEVTGSRDPGANETESVLLHKGYINEPS